MLGALLALIMLSGLGLARYRKTGTAAKEIALAILRDKGPF